MESAEQRKAVINLALILVGGILLTWISAFQQMSPLCRALSGQESGFEEKAGIMVYSKKNNNHQEIQGKTEFFIKIVPGGVEITKKIPEKKENYKYIVIKSTNDAITECDFFLKEWRRNPRLLVKALSFAFKGGETDLYFAERLIALQAIIRGGKTENLPQKTENQAEKADYLYSIEIINASGIQDLPSYAEKWLSSMGFKTTVFPVMAATQDKTDIFAYGSQKASEALKTAIKNDFSAEIREISIIRLAEKEKINAALVIGRRMGESIKARFAPKNDKDIKAKEEKSLEKAKTKQKTMPKEKRPVGNQPKRNTKNKKKK